MQAGRYPNEASMEGRPKLTDEPTWQKLQQYYNDNGSKINIYQLMKGNSNRFDKFRQVLLFLSYISIWNSTLEMTLLKHSYNFLYFSDKFALYFISIINANLQISTCIPTMDSISVRTESTTSKGSTQVVVRFKTKNYALCPHIALMYFV